VPFAQVSVTARMLQMIYSLIEPCVTCCSAACSMFMQEVMAACT
jgi:hypothetical protein